MIYSPLSILCSLSFYVAIDGFCVFEFEYYLIYIYLA